MEDMPSSEDLHKQFKYGTTELFFGPLNPGASESEFLQHVNNVGGAKLVSHQLQKEEDLVIYGILEYNNHADAATALENLLPTKFRNNPLQITFSPFKQDMSVGRVFVKNLDKSTDKKSLRDMFSEHGNILQLTIHTDDSGQCDGSAAVLYDCADSAKTAIANLNGKLLIGKELEVAASLKSLREDHPPDVFNKIYMALVSEEIDEADLVDIFGQFGEIVFVNIIPYIKEERYGVVVFRDTEIAAKALAALNNKTLGDDLLFTCTNLDNLNSGDFGRTKGTELHVENLHDSLTDVHLKAMFSAFGVVTSCKVQRHDNGASTGSGVVTFLAPNEATKAIAVMNGKMIKMKKLRVSLAEDQSASSEVNTEKLDSCVDQQDPDREAKKPKLAGAIDVHEAASKAKDAGHAASKEDAEHMDVEEDFTAQS